MNSARPSRWIKIKNTPWRSWWTAWSCETISGARLADSVETATSLSGGMLIVSVIDGEELVFSQNYACRNTVSAWKNSRRGCFPLNNPFGACPTCTGLSVFMKPDPDLILPDKSLSIRRGAVKANGWSVAEGGTIAQMYYEGWEPLTGLLSTRRLRSSPRRR